MLSACSEREAKPLELPEDIEETVNGFVEALEAGNTGRVRKFIAPDSLERFDQEFAAGAGEIEIPKGFPPRSIRRAPKGMAGNPFENEVDVLYARQEGDGWTVLTLNLYWLDEEEVKIEDWSFETAAPKPPELERQAILENVMRYGMLAMAGIAAIALWLIIWLARRKPDLIAPERAKDARPAAITRRDNEVE